MERQDPQGEENGDPAFAHLPRMAAPGNPHHPQLSNSMAAQGPHHPQPSASLKESNPSAMAVQKQPPQVAMSVSSSIPHSSVSTVSSTGPLPQGANKTSSKDAHQIKLQQLQSQQQQLMMQHAAAVASSATAQPSATTVPSTTGILDCFTQAIYYNLDYRWNK